MTVVRRFHDRLIPAHDNVLTQYEKVKHLLQYALESSSEPIGISEYELSRLYPENFKGTLPSIEEIEQEFSDNGLSD